jgi:hypothetical protein
MAWAKARDTTYKEDKALYRVFLMSVCPFSMARGKRGRFVDFEKRLTTINSGKTQI